MGTMQRSKGARAERELCAMLEAELGLKVRRNVDQARVGGADCVQVQGFAIEIKRRENLSRPTWWRQAVAQAATLGQEPMLFYRRSREPWAAWVHTRNGEYRETTFQGAVEAIREKWARWP
jgi:Holliday junction resolvase